MPGPTHTLLIEGSFRELAEELADYLEGLRKAQNGESTTSLRDQITPHLDKLTSVEEKQQEDSQDPEDDEEANEAKDDVLQILSKASSVLNSAPEKGLL